MNLRAEIELRKELNGCDNIEEMFKVLGKYYELENCKPNMFTKSIMISKLQDAVKYLKASPRKQYK